MTESDSDMAVSTHENDLPLMSNIQDIAVYHYVLDLRCFMDDKLIEGTVTLFCKPAYSIVVNTVNEASHEEQPSRADDFSKESLQEQASRADDFSKESLQEQASRADDFSKESLQEQASRADDFSKKSLQEQSSRADDFSKESLQEQASRADDFSKESLQEQSSRADDFSKESLQEQSSRADDFSKESLQEQTSRADDFSKDSLHHMPVVGDTSKLCHGDNCHSAISLQQIRAPRIDCDQSITVSDSSPLSFGLKSSTQTESIGKHKSTVSLDGDCPNNAGKKRLKCDQEDETLQEDLTCTNKLKIEERVPNTCGVNMESRFYMILDCSDISIVSVDELCYVRNCGEEIDHAYLLDKIEESKFLNDKIYSGERMEFIVEEHCVKISKVCCRDVNRFPGIIRIKFQTKPDGMSLKWTKDQDLMSCMFTHGHWINNRSLFPSQDVPVAMATWQATVHVEKELTVVMSGDRNPSVICEEDGWKSFYFYTRMSMPSSTLSLAVGHWKQVDICSDKSEILQNDENQGRIPCRLFVPERLLEKATQELGQYMPACLQSAYNTLGPHPFRRLDILVVPPCFDSLGMASLSVIYIAQSVLAGDWSMCVRLAHEVSHSWFGLAIGPEDWTEEWLTEGFATYLEDIIHHGALQILLEWQPQKSEEHREIRDYLRHRTLVAELQHTNQELQTLRPNKSSDVDCAGVCEGVTYVKHGRNPEKRFMQVHYLKGHFLLRFLEETVGKSKFLEVLCDFVKKFHEKLVTSKDVFGHLFEYCPELSVKALTDLYNKWLDFPGIPEKIKVFNLKSTNKTARTVTQQVSDTKLLIQKIRKRKKKILRNGDMTFLQQLDSHQIALYLELLTQEKTLPKSFLKQICEFYSLETCNADIQHRWCELIINNGLQTHYCHVKNFLVHHQAMGVYLFGELMIKRDKMLKKLAEDTFQEIQEDMEPDPYRTVKLMLYGE